MPTSELIAYVTAHTSAHVTKKDITKQLIHAGWSKNDIDEAFKQINISEFPAYSESNGNVSSLITQTFSVLKQNSITLFFLITFSLVIIALGSVLPFVFIMPLISAALKSHYAWYVYVAGGSLYLFLILIFTVLQSWGPCAIIYLLLYRNHSVGFFTALKKAWHKVTTFWTIGFLTNLIGFGIVSLMSTPIIFLVWKTFTSHAETKSYTLIAIVGGIIGLFIVGSMLCLSLWSYFSYFILVQEDSKALDALVKAKSLTTKRLLFTQVRLIVPVLILSGVSILMYISQSVQKSVPITVLGPAQGVICIAAVLFCTIYTVLLYEYIRDNQNTYVKRHMKRDKGIAIVLMFLSLLFPFILGFSLFHSIRAFGSDILQLFQNSQQIQTSKPHKPFNLNSPIDSHQIFFPT